MASLSPTTAPMSAKDGRSGSEGKKGPPLLRMAQREPCRGSKAGRPYGRVSARADAGNRGERRCHSPRTDGCSCGAGSAACWHPGRAARALAVTALWWR